ncbi:MAG: hypothetical protein ACK2U0_05800 [Candidatus Promineifilaceae bacterium]
MIKEKNMTKLFALFGNQKEAETAVNALNEAGLGRTSIRVLSQFNNELQGPLQLMPISHPTAGVTGAVGPRSRVDLTEDGLDGDIAGFFKRSLQKGAVLVAATLHDNAYKDRAESIFENLNAVAVASLDSD